MNEQPNKAGGISGIQRSLVGGESGKFNIPEGCDEVKQSMDHEVNEQPSKGGERGDLQQSLVGGESGQFDNAKGYDDVKQTMECREIDHLYGSDWNSEVKVENDNNHVVELKETY